VLPSPDGKWLAVQVEDGVHILPLDGSAEHPVQGITGDDTLVRVPDPASMFVSRFDKGFFHVDRVDIATGRRQHVRDIAAPDMAGAIYPRPSLSISADGKTYVTGITRWLTDLYIVEGLR
jgi:hypothetical protein